MTGLERGGHRRFAASEIAAAERRRDLREREVAGRRVRIDGYRFPRGREGVGPARGLARERDPSQGAREVRPVRRLEPLARRGVPVGRRGVAPLALRLTKRGVVKAAAIDLEGQVRYELAMIRRAFATEDSAEAKRAFFEKVREITGPE